MSSFRPRLRGRRRSEAKAEGGSASPLPLRAARSRDAPPPQAGAETFREANPPRQARRESANVLAGRWLWDSGRSSMREAVIVSTARTGLAKSYRGGFNNTHGAAMSGHAVKHAIERAKIDPGEVE